MCPKNFFIQIVVVEEVRAVGEDDFPPDMLVDGIQCLHPDFENRVRYELNPGLHALAGLVLIGDPLGLLPKVFYHGAPFVCELSCGRVHEAFLGGAKGYWGHPSRNETS